LSISFVHADNRRRPVRRAELPGGNTNAPTIMIVERASRPLMRHAAPV
jgi:hypothetical protein